MTEGYIYCLSNEAMLGIYKVGMTERTPEERLADANSSDTFRPPLPYKIEFAKKVLDPKVKEAKLHKILEKYSDRVNPRREFFRAELELIRDYFALLDGEVWSCSEPIRDTSDSDSSVQQKDGWHYRINKATGKKVRCKYVYPYASDGGKSVVNELVKGTPILGVSTSQKQNSKGFCKVAEYSFIWVNNKTVQDINGNVYNHKEGRVCLTDGSEEVKMRLMWGAEDCYSGDTEGEA